MEDDVGEYDELDGHDLDFPGGKFAALVSSPIIQIHSFIGEGTTKTSHVSCNGAHSGILDPFRKVHICVTSAPAP